MKTVIALALVASASAFVAPNALPAARQSTTSRSAVTMEMSPSLPMLPRPMKLKGWVGDVGFDPLGLSVRHAAQLAFCKHDARVRSTRSLTALSSRPPRCESPFRV